MCVPTAPHLGEPLVIPLHRLVRTRDEDEDWSRASVGTALEALCAAMTQMRHLVSLSVGADGFFHQTATALSTAGEIGRLPFQLKSLETNLFAAEGFAGFLRMQPSIKNLTQHWRRDRFLNEPGSLSAVDPNANPNVSANGETGTDADAGGVGTLPVPSAETQLNPHIRPILPNLRHLEHSPRGMVEVIRGRPVESIVTTLREVRDVGDLMQALESSQATVTRLKVNAEATEVLRPFLERLSLVRQGTPLTRSVLSAHPSGGVPRLTPEDNTKGIGQPQQVGNGLEMLSITVQAHRDVSPFLLLEQPAEQVHDLLSNFQNGFPRLHTLRWGGPLVPPAVRRPELYAGPALRTVLTETMGVPGNKYIRVFDGEHEGVGRWEKVVAPRPKADGSRRREVFQRIGSHDVLDVEDDSWSGSLASIS